MTVSININDLIRTRLAEISEAAWRDHRVMPVSSDGRVIEVGTAATTERWSCADDHGSGVCGESLLTHRQASELLGLLNPDEPVRDPQIPVIDLEVLDEEVGGFTCGSLYHLSDVVAEARTTEVR